VTQTPWPASEPAYTYRGVVDRVIDGDTFVLLLDLGFYCSYRPHVRLYGVNAPELKTTEGKAAKSYVETLLKPYMPLLVRSHKDERTFERWVAEVSFLQAGQWLDLAQTLLTTGHAEVWNG
jgi:endonuclease YncB( thermonuclease family)